VVGGFEGNDPYLFTVVEHPAPRRMRCDTLSASAMTVCDRKNG
jgi:hypothetical protein